MPPRLTCGVVGASWPSSSWGALSSLASTRWTSWERSLGFSELPPRLSGPPTPLWWVHNDVLDSGIVWFELVHSHKGFHVIYSIWGYSLVRAPIIEYHSQVREAFSVQQSQGLDSLMAGLDPQALDLLKVCLLDVYQLHVSSLRCNFLSFPPGALCMSWYLGTASWLNELSLLFLNRLTFMLFRMD